MKDHYSCGAQDIDILDGAEGLRGIFVALSKLDFYKDADAVRGLLLAGKPLAMRHAEIVAEWYDQFDSPKDKSP